MSGATPRFAPRAAVLWSLATLLVCWVAGCSVLPDPTPPPRKHDLGPLPAGARPHGPGCAFEGVEVPAWLRTDAIH